MSNHLIALEGKLSTDDRFITPCRCGHSKYYHRQIDNLYLECFASPKLAPPCKCAQYRPFPTKE